MEGRFISEDPLSFAGGDVNLYGYVQNNSINYNDPYGLMSRREYCQNVTFTIGTCADLTSLGAAITGNIPVSVAATLVSIGNSVLTYSLCGNNQNDVRSAATGLAGILSTLATRGIYGIIISALSILEDFESLPNYFPGFPPPPR